MPQSESAAVEMFVNCRTLGAPVTGVQRYLGEILQRTDSSLHRLAPEQPTHGFPGHVWDQKLAWTLPRDALLWSPANTGPLWHRNQVVTIHDVAALDHPEWLSWKFATWYRWLTPRLARRVRAVIAVSEFSRQRLLAHARIPADRVHVVHNGVDSRFVPQTRDAVDAAVTALGLPSRRYALSLGSLEPRKNLRLLLQAWVQALPRLPSDLWLVVAGLKGAGRIHGDAGLPLQLPPRVWLPGHVADPLLPALYGGAELFVYPSVYEGFGLPPLEAMACGVPVITASTTALPEVVGDAGLMVDPTSADAWAGAMLSLVEDPSMHARLGEAGRSRAARFTWERCAQATLEILRECAATPA